MATPAPSGDTIDAHFSKKRLLGKEKAPAKLWTFALEAVLSQIAAEAPDQLVEMIASDAQLRQLMVEEIVRKPHPALQLGDTDIIEVFRMDVDIGEGLHPGHHDEWRLTVGELPRRLRTALKYQFDMYALAVEKEDSDRMPTHGEFWCSADGRLCFECTSTANRKNTKWVQDAYMNMVEGVVEEENVPGWQEVQCAQWDDVNPTDNFAFLVEDTLLYDAYDCSINQDMGEERVRKLVHEQFRDTFCSLAIGCDAMDEKRYSTGPTTPLSTAWIRKPKIRVWVSMM